MPASNPLEAGLPTEFTHVMPDSTQPASPGATSPAQTSGGPAYPDNSSAWDGRRRSKVATDRALTGAALDWMISLPMHIRPKQLCDRYPRIANSVAAVWKDRQACLLMLKSLLEDNRARRRGFPVILRQEIQSLVDYRDKQSV